VIYKLLVFVTLNLSDCQCAPGQISCTVDMWLNQSHYPFLAMTGHWISKAQNGSLKFNCALLAFHRVCESHNGERLAWIVLHLLD
jgi:hypothetical protein